MLNHVVTTDDINRNLLCTVSTSSPVFSTETSVELNVHGMTQFSVQRQHKYTMSKNGTYIFSITLPKQAGYG